MQERKPAPATHEAGDKVDTFPIFRTLFDLCRDYECAHAQFPKVHKHTIGGRLSVCFAEALEAVIAAVVQKSRREEHLVRAVVLLEKARILCRLAHEIRCMDPKRYARFSRLIVSALEQLAAFLKSGKVRCEQFGKGSRCQGDQPIAGSPAVGGGTGRVP